MLAPRIAALAVIAALLSGAAAAQTTVEPAPRAAAPAGAAAPKEVTLPARKLVFVGGHADFDNVYGALVAGLKTVRAWMDKEGLSPAGPAIARFADGGESGFQFEAGYPVAGTPKDKPPEGIGIGDAPSGKFLAFVHRGAFDDIDEAYSAVDDYFRTRGRPPAEGSEANEDGDVLADSFEEYVADPVTTPPEKSEVQIMVPVK